jgi:L,D-transpeptidase ErfK/SrfK
MRASSRLDRLRLWTARTALLGLAAGLACTLVPPPRPEPPPAEELPSDITGAVERYQAHAEDTLIDLAVQHDLGYVEIVSANPGVDPWLPGAGTEILLPKAHLFPSAPRKGIVVNLPEQRLYFYPDQGAPLTFPIGIGREGFETPLGATQVVRKKLKPTWYPGPSARADDPTLARAVPPGEDNPLGSFAMYLGLPSYLIHGTNQPYGVGRRSSRGCIRLYEQDIEQLFERVPVGTPVRMVSEQYKLGWFRGELYLEAHPNLEQATELEDTGSFTPEKKKSAKLEKRIRDAAGVHAERINWDEVQTALRELRGIPTRITDPAPTAASGGRSGARFGRAAVPARR